MSKTCKSRFCIGNPQNSKDFASFESKAISNSNEEQKNDLISFKEKKSRSSNNSKNLFFFTEAGTFTNFISSNDFRSKEEYIEKKKDFIIQQMRSKCPCPCILAVDDNDFNNLIMTMHASRLEIPIITALSGVEALQKIEEQQKNPCCNFFKIIFMDIEMPLMNGLETFERIQKIYQNKQKLKVIPVTGHSEGNDMLEKAKKIMGEAMFKPISFEYLVIFLEKYIREIYEEGKSI